MTELLQWVGPIGVAVTIVWGGAVLVRHLASRPRVTIDTIVYGSASAGINVHNLGGDRPARGLMYNVIQSKDRGWMRFNNRGLQTWVDELPEGRMARIELHGPDSHFLAPELFEVRFPVRDRSETIHVVVSWRRPVWPSGRRYAVIEWGAAMRREGGVMRIHEGRAARRLWRKLVRQRGNLDPIFDGTYYEDD